MVQAWSGKFLIGWLLAPHRGGAQEISIQPIQLLVLEQESSEKYPTCAKFS